MPTVAIDQCSFDLSTVSPEHSQPECPPRISEEGFEADGHSSGLEVDHKPSASGGSESEPLPAIECLPQELIAHILDYLELKEQILFALSSRHIYPQVHPRVFREIPVFPKKNCQNYRMYILNLIELWQSYRFGPSKDDEDYARAVDYDLTDAVLNGADCFDIYSRCLHLHCKLEAALQTEDTATGFVKFFLGMEPIYRVVETGLGKTNPTTSFGRGYPCVRKVKMPN